MFSQDILINIFLRLRVKTLVVSSCVCKLWRNIVTDPLFVNTHFTISLENSHHRRKLTFLKDYPMYMRYDSLTIEPDSIDLVELLDWPCDRLYDLCCKTEEPFGGTSETYCHLIFNACNGLILVSYIKISSVESHFFILNPSTRTFMPLPSFDCCSVQYFVGLGFDSVSNDYKVVIFSSPLQDGFISIYSLSTNSWKDISFKVQFPHCVADTKKPLLLMNGYLHWIAWSNTSSVDLIVRFDVSSEVLDSMSGPLTVEIHHFFRITSIAVVFEKLCYAYYSTGNGCFIWIMDEYGVVESWTMKYRLADSITSFPLFHVLGSVKDEIILHSDRGHFVSYDPESNRMTDLGIRGPVRFYYMDNFVESLVLFGSNNTMRRLDSHQVRIASVLAIQTRQDDVMTDCRIELS